jgi:hypothetical protein
MLLQQAHCVPNVDSFGRCGGGGLPHLPEDKPLDQIVVDYGTWGNSRAQSEVWFFEKDRPENCVAPQLMSHGSANSIAERRPKPRPREQASYCWARWVSRLCFASLLLALILTGLVPRQSSSSSVAARRRPEGAKHSWTNKPIETIRVGDRVLTNHADGGPRSKSQVNPATWKRVKMLAWARWADIPFDDIHIETLQPPEWLAAHNVRVGAWVPLPLDLVEMGMPEDMRGQVMAIEPCPMIKPGRGRVVQTTVNHLNANLRELRVQDGKGHQETIRPTGFHKFYRATDGKWVSAEDLVSGDQLQGHRGMLRVLANTRFPGIHRVYNLTVETEHVYRVSSLGALVHNNGCGPYSNISDGTKVAPGRHFQPKQKENILEENMKRNNGVIRSDNPLDPWYGKDLVPPPKGPFKPGKYPPVDPNQAQIDHIVPRIGPDGKPLGTNSYGNAQVISAEYNNMCKNKPK